MNNAIISISLERNFTIKNNSVWFKLSRLWRGVDAVMDYVKHEQ